jgi:hypothetical protein
VEERVVLKRGVEVALAVEDRDRDVASRGKQVLELGRPIDPDRVEACGPQLRQDGTLLAWRKGCDDRRTGHEVGS